MAYWEDERNATSHGLGAVQVSFGAEEQILFAFGGFPGYDGGAIEEDLNGFTGGQTCSDAGIIL